MASTIPNSESYKGFNNVDFKGRTYIPKNRSSGPYKSNDYNDYKSNEYTGVFSGPIHSSKDYGEDSYKDQVTYNQGDYDEKDYDEKDYDEKDYNEGNYDEKDYDEKSDKTLTKGTPIDTLDLAYAETNSEKGYEKYSDEKGYENYGSYSLDKRRVKLKRSSTKRGTALKERFVNLSFNPYMRSTITNTLDFIKTLGYIEKDDLDLGSFIDVNLYGEGMRDSRVRLTFNPYDYTSTELASKFVESFLIKKGTYV